MKLQSSRLTRLGSTCNALQLCASNTKHQCTTGTGTKCRSVQQLVNRVGAKLVFCNEQHGAHTCTSACALCCISRYMYIYMDISKHCTSADLCGGFLSNLGVIRLLLQLQHSSGFAPELSLEVVHLPSPPFILPLQLLLRLLMTVLKSLQLLLLAKQTTACNLYALICQTGTVSLHKRPNQHESFTCTTGAPSRLTKVWIGMKQRSDDFFQHAGAQELSRHALINAH